MMTKRALVIASAATGTFAVLALIAFRTWGELVWYVGLPAYVLGVTTFTVVALTIARRASRRAKGA